MGEVIGYKGTEYDRAVEWTTLLALRKVMKFSRDHGHLDAYNEERQMYENSKATYMKAA